MLLGHHHVPQYAIDKAVWGGESLHVRVCGAEFTIEHGRAIVRTANFSKVLQLQSVRNDQMEQIRFEVADEGIMYVVYQDYMGNDPCTFEVHDLLRGKAAPLMGVRPAATIIDDNPRRKQVLLLC